MKNKVILLFPIIYVNILIVPLLTILMIYTNSIEGYILKNHSNNFILKYILLGIAFLISSFIWDLFMFKGYYFILKQKYYIKAKYQKIKNQIKQNNLTSVSFFGCCYNCKKNSLRVSVLSPEKVLICNNCKSLNNYGFRIERLFVPFGFFIEYFVMDLNIDMALFLIPTTVILYYLISYLTAKKMIQSKAEIHLDKETDFL